MGKNQLYNFGSEEDDRIMMLEFLKELKKAKVPQLKSFMGCLQYSTIRTHYDQLINYLEHSITQCNQ